MGITLLTLAIMSTAVVFLTDSSNSLGFILFSMLILFLPSSQSAVQLMNYLITSLLQPEIIPKLDFTEGIPDNCVTMVAVPTLLLNEKQVRGLVESLEVRFLGNHDPNVHFALLTDLPDSREPAREDSPLVALCSDLIHGLNEKYASENMGSFFMFHRHRVYNPREKSWMGWERKRGKLLDFNRLLRGQYDSFPVKVGELSLLPRVRFVITLDSDTELPRGTAHRMVGAMAHPLNQAIIDPHTNTVVTGYGILQPRVGVSVQSTARSRLAAIYAGETGFDIYTRAISDAYQDLYGEGSFTGKGIYEVDAVHRVLEHRFPRNALLSHDLLEGAYARAGLASDIELIEDYPSHYNAYNRRKHRWLRGDWQIAGWLFRQVPGESVERVSNPISLISWWKIFDNLRRSLVEPATFVLLVVGWFMPGRPAWQWTLATICISFIPAWAQFGFNLVRALFDFDPTVARDALSSALHSQRHSSHHADLSCPSDHACAGCSGARAGQALCHARPAFGMGNSGGIGTQSSRAGDRGRVSQLDAFTFDFAGTSGVGVAAPGSPGCAADLIALGLQQTGFRLAESCSGHGTKPNISQGCGVPSARGFENLEIFCRVQHRGAQLADTGQRSGETCSSGGTGLPDEHRASTQCEAGGM